MSQSEGRMGLPQWHLDQQGEAGRADAQATDSSAPGETALRQAVQAARRSLSEMSGVVAAMGESYAPICDRGYDAIRGLWEAEALAANPAPAPTRSDILEMIGNAPWRFWTCPRGCQGVVSWEGNLATCGKCGTNSAVCINTAPTPSAGDARAEARSQILQVLVGNWGEATFPHATFGSIVKHLHEEVGEIDRELYKVDHPGLAEECADAYLMLLHLAHRGQFDLHAEACKKFDAVKNSEWEYDVQKGYSKRKKALATAGGE